MAENIGKIVVSIEAEVAELRKGLAQAEAEFKKSADKMVEEQQKLGSKFKKSWTELKNKVTVYQMAIGAATKAIKTLDKVTKIWGNDSLETHEQIIKTFDAFADSGIPIVAEFSQLIMGLGMLFSDLDEVQRSLIETQDMYNRQLRSVRVAESFEAGVQSLEKQLTRKKALLEIDKARARGESGITEQFDMQINAMKAEFDASNKAEKERLAQAGFSEKFYVDAMERRKQAQNELLEVVYENERMAFDAWNTLQDEKQERIDEQFRIDKEHLDRLAKIAEENAERVANKTSTLEEQLAIMIAKRDGDLEKAKILAIESRYRRMSVGATEAQQKAIDAMKAIELASVGAGGVTPAATGGGGGTASISTAIGGFTVATGRTELKKQTNFLERIANATEKLGEGEVVILAA